MAYKWKLIFAELGCGIECLKCSKRVNADDVIFGNIDITKCPKCGSTMLPLTDLEEGTLKDALKERRRDN